MISGLAGVAIWTDRVRDLVAFYRDIVGLRVHRENGPQITQIAQMGDELASSPTGRSVRGERVREFPYESYTTSIASAVLRMLAAGVAFLRMPERESWGGWIATFQDPDGNMVQLLQLPEGTDQARR